MYNLELEIFAVLTPSAYIHAISHNHIIICVMHVSVVKNHFEYRVAHLHTCRSVQYTDMHVTGHVDAEVINPGGELGV